MLEAVLEADACASLSEMQKTTSSKGRPEYTVNVTLCAEVRKAVGRGGTRMLGCGGACVCAMWLWVGMGG